MFFSMMVFIKNVILREPKDLSREILRVAQNDKLGVKQPY